MDLLLTKVHKEGVLRYINGQAAALVENGFIGVGLEMQYTIFMAQLGPAGITAM